MSYRGRERYGRKRGFETCALQTAQMRFDAGACLVMQTCAIRRCICYVRTLAGHTCRVAPDALLLAILIRNAHFVTELNSENGDQAGSSSNSFEFGVTELKSISISSV